MHQMAFAKRHADMTGLPTIISGAKVGRESGGDVLILALHYAPCNVGCSRDGWWDSNGAATCPTTRVLEEMGKEAIPGRPFCSHFDIYLDLFDSVHWYKGDDGKPFNFRAHFYSQFPPEQRDEWLQLKLTMLAWMIVDEIVERGRTGAFVIVGGGEANDVWRGLLTRAVEQAKQIVAEQEGDAAARAEGFELKFETGEPDDESDDE